MAGFAKINIKCITYPLINSNSKNTLCTYLQNINTDVCSKNYKGNSVLQPTPEDLSTITPYYPKSFNLAAYVNSSETLQNLMHLNVNLSKIEKKPYIAEKILKLDFERNVKNHILFIKDFVSSEIIGDFISKNPMILCESLEDLEVRINYLQCKNFSEEQIQRIVSSNPFWLMFSTTRIDQRLGYFQDNFQLNGKEVRFLATKQPNIITYSLQHIKCNTFSIREEMGFEDHELKRILIDKPKLFMIDNRSLLERFNYIHNVIKLSHNIILDNPQILLCRNFRVKQRHLFLENLGRAQYDPKKPNYINVKALVEGTDAEFSIKYAKCNVGDFNTFLKTL